jgi:competence protein ComEA
MKKTTALITSAAAVLCFLLFLAVYGVSFAPAGVSVHVDRAAAAEDARLNINTATAKELETLPGIGPALSTAIVAYREESGSFTKAEDLLEVPGIGQKKLDAIREMLRFD